MYRHCFTSQQPVLGGRLSCCSVHRNGRVSPLCVTTRTTCTMNCQVMNRQIVNRELPNLSPSQPHNWSRFGKVRSQPNILFVLQVCRTSLQNFGMGGETGCTQYSSCTFPQVLRVCPPNFSTLYQVWRQEGASKSAAHVPLVSRPGFNLCSGDWEGVQQKEDVMWASALTCRPSDFNTWRHTLFHGGG